MGRRHSKYIFYVCILLLLGFPLYYLLDMNTTAVLPSPAPTPGYDDKLQVRLRARQGGPPQGGSRDRAGTAGGGDRGKVDVKKAPTVVLPKALPYPTKARPGAPWREYGQPRGNSSSSPGSPGTPGPGRRGDSGDRAQDSGAVVVQAGNHSLLIKQDSQESIARDVIDSVPRDDIDSVPRDVMDRHPPADASVVKETSSVVKEANVKVKNSTKGENSGQLLGGIAVKNMTSPSPSSLPVPSKPASPTAKVTANVAADKPQGQGQGQEVEDWKKLLDYQNEVPPPLAFDAAPRSDPRSGSRSDAEGTQRPLVAGKLSPGQAVITKSNLSATEEDKHSWKKYFDNPAEVKENNEHVKVDMNIPIVGKKHVYPTKPRPAAPGGVDFYRGKGKAGEVNIVGAEPQVPVTPKPTDNVYNVFDEEAKLQAWDTRRTYPPLPGENIVSMTLYGSDPRYTMGAIRNAEMIGQNFPGWKLRVYTEAPGETARYGAVPATVLASLRNLGAELYFMQPGEDYIPPMMWRFLVADDTWVSRFIVRDADARLTERDAAAVHAWVTSGKPFTCVRDHPSHAGYAISGGMWGGKPQEIRNILRKSWRDLMKGVRSDYLQDMNFLNHVVWPKMSAHAYCSDSVSCDQWPGAHPFPVPRYGYEHVGQVFNEHDLGRPIDIQLLRLAGENEKCSPKDDPRDT